jgi:DNA mismatch repair protein MutS2
MTGRNAQSALEWTRFLILAEKEASTELGRERIRALEDPARWAPSVETSRLRQQETQEVSLLLARDALWGPLSGLLDPKASLERLDRGATLDVPELVMFRGWLYAIDSWSQVPRDEIRGDLFKRALTQLPDPTVPLRIVDSILTPEGELSERASPKLGSLNSEIRSLKREIQAVLDGLMKTFSQKGVLQENFTDVRDGRYVLPIKISQQNEVEGNIYEASASRQTVFVEPKEVAALNNRLRQKQNELAQEVYIILTETSKRLKPYGAELESSIEILAHWDEVHARALFGRHYSGKAIYVTEDRAFYLKHSAHPLLWWSLSADQIIRNDIEFGEPARALLLTGPNTGGKTVLLKTLGLAGLCARTGFPFPAVDQPIVPFFDSFFADLGDEQSIEAHLSTFAGHVMRFKEILAQTTERSLVLMDELNSATDPEEGAALGRAFLETVMGKGALVVATTHDPHLKALAFSDQRIVNASMAFDEGSRVPTYRLAIGVAGRSRALETAERLGIPADVLRIARSYLSDEHRKFEALLSKIEADAQEAQRSRNQANNLREEAERLKKEWTERTETSVGEMLERTRQKLRRILEQAQDEVRASVRKLDEAKSRKDVDENRSKLNETLSWATERMETALAEEAPDVAETLAKRTREKTEAAKRDTALSVGSQVRVPKWKSTGTILELKGGKAKVAMGTIQMSLSLEDIEPLSSIEAAQVAAIQRPKQKSRGTSSDAPPAPDKQLDLRGQRFDEAMREVERYVDQAFRSGTYVEVTIVHGLGTGALREGTRKLLKGLPYVKAFRDDGSPGATLVEFER